MFKNQPILSIVNNNNNNNNNNKKNYLFTIYYQGKIYIID